jgi:predicted dehydrogenase
LRKVGLGIIGCGLGAQALYASFFPYLENGRLVACMDIDGERARAFQEQSGAEAAYTELAPMLDRSDIDAVMIVTPTNLHVEQVLAVAEGGKHVYCEKPMARTIEEADRMIDACRANSVKLQVAFMKRFNRSFGLAKQTIDDGRLGDVFELRATWDNARAAASAEDNYRHRSISGGGYLQEDGSHPLDVCRWWLGEVSEVTGHVMIVAANRFENEDVGAIVMKHLSGAMSSLHITMLSHRTGMESYEVFGTKGTLLVEWPFHSTHTLEPAFVRLFEHATEVTDLTLSTSWNPHEELLTNWQYLNELRHFCDCIIHDREPAVGGADGRATVEILNAAYLSAREGRTVSLPLDRSPDLEPFFEDVRGRSRWHIGDDDAWWGRY